MNKPKKGLVGFGSVANIENNNEIDNNIENNINKDLKIDNNNEVNVNGNIDSNNEIEKESDITINDSIKSIGLSIIEKKKKESNRQVTVYIEPDLAKELDKFGKKYGKGDLNYLIIF